MRMCSAATGLDENSRLMVLLFLHCCRDPCLVTTSLSCRPFRYNHSSCAQALRPIACCQELPSVGRHQTGTQGAGSSE